MPSPELGLQPAEGTTLANLPTVLSTEAEEFTRDLRLLNQAVHLRIYPESYSFNVGEGTPIVTDWPGKPYEDGVLPRNNPDEYITHTYETSGPRSLSVTVTWAAEFSVRGGPMQPVIGTVPMTSSEIALQVDEAEPGLTQPR